MPVADVTLYDLASHNFRVYDRTVRTQAMSLINCNYHSLARRKSFFTRAAEMIIFLYRHKVINWLDTRDCKEYGTVCRNPFCRIRQSIPTLPILPNFFSAKWASKFGKVGIEIRQSAQSSCLHLQKRIWDSLPKPILPNSAKFPYLAHFAEFFFGKMGMKFGKADIEIRQSGQGSCLHLQKPFLTAKI